MKHLVISFVIGVFTLGLVVPDAEARRFGGGGNFGMQRQMSPQQAPRQPATQNVNRQQGAAAQNRSWMGPIAGLAAGLGLAALFAHLGLGEELASFLLIALMIAAAVFLFRMLARRAQASNRMSFASQHSAHGGAQQPMQFARHEQHPAPASYVGGTGAPVAHPDFDAEAFARQAKVNFIRLQAAYDEGNLTDIREFTSPEVFAEIRMQLADAPVGAVQRTDIIDLEAEVLDVVEEDERYIVSVRFNGMLREDPETPPAAFDEIWHLTKDRHGDRGWIIAGIQQAA